MNVHPATTEEELLALLALKKAPLVVDIMAKKLIRTFGSAQEVFKQPHLLY